MDVIPDGLVKFGFPNISDNAEIVEMMASGAHMTLFVTGRGSVVGSALAPVIKIAANPEMYGRLHEDMDVNAGRIMEGTATLDEIGTEIYEQRYTNRLLLSLVAYKRNPKTLVIVNSS